MNRLSIKALIAAAFVLILAMALAATAQLVVTDRMTRAALERHEQATRANDPAAILATHRELEQALALGAQLTLIMRISTFFIGLWLAVAVYRRVGRLVDATSGFAGRIERGEFEARFAGDAGGETAALAGALNRMVERLRAAAEGEAVLRRRLDFLVEHSPAVIYAARAGGDYGANWISPNVRRQLGHTAEDFTNDSAFWVNNLHPEERERVLKEQEKLFSEGRLVLEYRFRHADGTWRWMRDETRLVRDAAGQPLELVGSWVDISERRALEASLARRDAILEAVAYGAGRFLSAGEAASEAQWRLAVEQVLSHLGEATGVSRIWVAENQPQAGGETRVRVAHHWAQARFAVAERDPMFGERPSYREVDMEVEALRLRRGELLQLRTGELPEPMRARLARLGIRTQLLAPIKTGEGWWGFIAFDNCDEERLWSEVELETLHAAASLFGAAILARTGREALRASLERLGSAMEKLKAQSDEIEWQNAELARASRMKSEFLAAVTHELKTPLNGIIGFADLIEAGVAGPLTAQQKEYAGEILGCGRQLEHLVSRILGLAQIEAGKTSFAPQALDAGLLLRQAACAQEKAAQARGISMAVEAEDAAVLADPRLLRRLLDELVGNAVKFNRDGGKVTLGARRISPPPRPSPVEGEGASLASRVAGEGRQAGGDVIEITIADSGPGIAAEDLAHLFQPFVQFDATLERKHGGTGIGLVLAQRIAQLHGGRIEAACTPGAGCTFSVRLPAAPAESPA